MRTRFPWRPLAAVLVAASLGWPASAEPWVEPGYGLTLAPPADAVALRPPPPGALGGWVAADGALLRVRIVESEAAIGGLKQTQAAGWADFTIGVRRSSWLEERRVAGRPGLVQVLELVTEASQFLPPGVQPGETTYGQVMLKLDPYRLALVELFRGGLSAEQMKPRVQALADAVSLVEPPRMMDRRRAEIERSADFLGGLNVAAALPALPPRLDFSVAGAAAGTSGVAHRRVLTDPAEVGTLTASPGGTGFAATAYLATDDGAGNRRAEIDEAWSSDDRRREVWSGEAYAGRVGNTTGGGLPGPSKATAGRKRTGVRNGPLIDVILSGSEAGAGVDRGISGDVPKSWEIPERLPPSLIDGTDVRVSPVDVFLDRSLVLLLPELLPRDSAADYAFYALDPGSLTLSLRLYRVEPRPGGGADVTERPTPAAAPVLHRLDASGVLTRVVRPDGLTLTRQP